MNFGELYVLFSGFVPLSGIETFTFKIQRFAPLQTCIMSATSGSSTSKSLSSSASDQKTWVRAILCSKPTGEGEIHKVLGEIDSMGAKKLEPVTFFCIGPSLIDKETWKSHVMKGLIVR